MLNLKAIENNGELPLSWYFIAYQVVPQMSDAATKRSQLGVFNNVGIIKFRPKPHTEASLADGCLKFHD